MRVSTRYQYETYKSDMATALARYSEAQNKVSTGKRINELSDSPYEAGTLLNLRNLQSRFEQYQNNLGVAKRSLTLAESTLGEIGSLFNKATQIAVSGANGITSQQARDAMVVEVSDLQKRLVDLGNSRGVSGEYLFAGQKTDTKPFSSVLGVLSFNGDDLGIAIESGSGETMELNIKSGGAITRAFDTLEHLKTSLQGGNVGDLSGIDIPAIQANQAELVQLRGVAGTRLKNVETLTTDYSRRIDDFQSKISDIEDVDIAEALLDYRQAETAYQAALSVTSQGFKLSLMDFIRG